MTEPPLLYPPENGNRVAQVKSIYAQTFSHTMLKNLRAIQVRCRSRALNGKILWILAITHLKRPESQYLLIKLEIPPGRAESGRPCRNSGNDSVKNSEFRFDYARRAW